MFSKLTRASSFGIYLGCLFDMVDFCKYDGFWITYDGTIDSFNVLLFVFLRLTPRSMCSMLGTVMFCFLFSIALSHRPS